MPRADRADAPGRAPSAPPLERRRPVACAGLSLLLTLLVLGSCRSLDEGVLDDRLRSATVDAYLDFIEDEFGGMSSSETTLTALREDHRAEAIAASSPEDFYGVLRRMAADLDDPHASLVASERFWSGPLATPERCAVTVADGEVWLALPAESVRTPAGLAEALDGWLDGIGDKVAAGGASSERSPAGPERHLSSRFRCSHALDDPRYGGRCLGEVPPRRHAAA